MDMRRILLFIVTLFIVTLSVNAQHMKFLGIPMNTNITNFSAKLKSKGYTIAPKNKLAGTGLRIMEGRFYNQNAELWISYTPSTKMVYSVRVVFWSDSEEVCKSFMEEIETSISEKYICTYEKGKTKGGSDIDIFYINEVKGDEYVYIGDIYIGISDDTSYYGYNLNLTYEDRINRLKNEESKSDDI